MCPQALGRCARRACAVASARVQGMLCDFCDRLGTDNPDVPLLPEPSTANSIQVKLKPSGLGTGSTSLFRENYNDSSSRASMGSVDGDVRQSLELGGSVVRMCILWFMFAVAQATPGVSVYDYEQLSGNTSMKRTVCTLLQVYRMEIQTGQPMPFQCHCKYLNVCRRLLSSPLSQ